MDSGSRCICVSRNSGVVERAQSLLFKELLAESDSDAGGAFPGVLGVSTRRGNLMLCDTGGFSFALAHCSRRRFARQPTHRPP